MSRYNSGFVPKRNFRLWESMSTGMINFETSPERYRHWKLEVEGPVATLSMDVQ